MSPETVSNLNDIIAKIKDGKICLFIGAGVSCHAGLPSGKELVKRLKNHFPKADQSHEDFMELCDDIIETLPYSRYDLSEKIKLELSGYSITDAHLKLTKYNWSAIFTTNYDDIIESAYTQSAKKIKSCQDIYTNVPSISGIGDKNKVCLFKIMGTVRANETEGEMVLTTTDLLHSFQKRSNYFSLLKDFLKNGSIVFIGYSFNDKIVKQAIDDIVRFSGGAEKLPYSYALFKDAIPADEKIKHYYSSRRVIPVQCDFEQFVNYIDDNYHLDKSETTDVNTISLTIRGKVVRIKESELVNYSTNFDLLYEDFVSNSKTSIEDFYKGDIVKWQAYHNNWDFIREPYNFDDYYLKANSSKPCIYNFIQSELKKTDPENNKIILIKGMPGCGKSVLLHRIAYDIYSQRDNPVVILNNKLFNYDKKLITGFIEDVRERYSNSFSESEVINNVKFVIIVDDYSSKFKDILLLRDFLTSRGRSALFIVASRSNELEGKVAGINNEYVYELPEILTDQEVVKISQHFSKLGFSYFSLDRIQQIIKSEYERSFFATVYSLIHPSRKPLDEIIRDQYTSLKDLAQQVFSVICCFSQFNIPINIELLVRAIGVSYQTFVDEILKGEAHKIIFEEFDINGNLFLKAHHPIIAKKTIEFFLSDSKVLLDNYLQIFSNANFSVDIEREICEKIIINHLKGRESLDRSHMAYFTNNQLIRIFDIICKKNATRSLLHHYALLVEEDRDYDKANELLVRALNESSEGESFFSGESDQNILTSIGSLNSKLGQDALKKGDVDRAEKYFSTAEEYYKRAKYANFSDGHAYHSHAFMWFMRGKKHADVDSGLSFSCYANALEILANAKDNMNDESLEAIIDLENKLYIELGNEEKSAELIEVLRDKFKSAKGYYIVALMKYNKAVEEKIKGNIEESKRLFKIADEKINKGLTHFNNDENCLTLKCKIVKERSPYNYETQFDYLQLWKNNCKSPNAKLLYDFGRVSFILGLYDISRSSFDELQKGVGYSNRDRSRALNPILDNDTRLPSQFEGKIFNIISLYEGFIQAYSLKDLKHRIIFSPIACKFTPSVGNLVRFTISFSFRGPVAENVTKI